MQSMQHVTVRELAVQSSNTKKVMLAVLSLKEASPSEVLLWMRRRWPGCRTPIAVVAGSLARLRECHVLAVQRRGDEFTPLNLANVYSVRNQGMELDISPVQPGDEWYGPTGEVEKVKYTETSRRGAVARMYSGRVVMLNRMYATWARVPTTN